MVLKIDIVGDLSKCSPDCEEFLTKWSEWCKEYDGKRLALIEVNDDYFSNLPTKSKHMVTKVKRRGYVFHGFSYNNYLQDIYEINTSKKERQGKLMTESYTTYPSPINDEFHGCDLHKYLRIGAFKNRKMYAYCAIAILNELGILNTIIGHADALTDGVMNGLINYLVMVCDVKYLNYLTMESSGESLRAFKKRVGFESCVVNF